MIPINVNVDAARVLLELEGLRNGPKRFAYAIERSGNETLKLIQKTEFEHVEDRLIIRNRPFFFGSVDRPGGAAARITRFFSVRDGRPFGEVAIQASSQASQRTLLLGEFERGGGLRRPFTPGAKNVAVPITGRPARPSINRGVPPAFTIAGLKLKAYRGKRVVKRPGKSKTPERGFGDSGAVVASFDRLNNVQWKGLQRTFVLTRTPGADHGGVFQRFGPERGDIREIYAFLPPFPLEDKLDWEPTAQLVGDRWFPIFLESEVDKTLRIHGFKP